MEKVKVYSIERCPWCQKVKKYLTSRGIDYEEYDIEKDEIRAKELEELTGELKVPVTVIGDWHMYRFDRQELDKKLKEAGYL